VFASGSYFTQEVQFRLLGLSSNGGKDWTFPTIVFKNLNTSIAPDLTTAT
jgi:hypothetical protein